MKKKRKGKDKYKDMIFPLTITRKARFIFILALYNRQFSNIYPYKNKPYHEKKRAINHINKDNKFITLQQ